MAFEIMIVNPAIRNLIRENKIFQIENVLQTSSNVGMITMDQSLYDMYRSNVISSEIALQYSVDSKAMASRLNIGANRTPAYSNGG